MQQNRKLIGIIGGMGPKASAELLQEVYEANLNESQSERDLPRMVLVSDPLAPDRKLSYEQDQFETLTKFLQKTILQLQTFEIDTIIICCLVAHACIPKIIETAQVPNIVSMVGLLGEAIQKQQEKVLLLSTPMFYELQLLADENIIYLTKNELDMINKFIYQFKLGVDASLYQSFNDYIEKLLIKYQVNAVALACSDLHMFNKYRIKNHLDTPYQIIDAVVLTVNYLTQNEVN